MPFNPAFRRASPSHSGVVVSTDRTIEQKAVKGESAGLVAQRFAAVVSSDKMMT
jgi:hypothetical protein